MNPIFPTVSNHHAAYLLESGVQTNSQPQKEVQIQDPYKAWSRQLVPKPKQEKTDDEITSSSIVEDEITKMASKNAVTVFSRSGCCLCHVVKQLLQGLGANPVVHEIEDDYFMCFDRNFEKVVGNFQFPTVFIGGELYGGLDRVIATHISGELVPLLKQVGALWL